MRPSMLAPRRAWLMADTRIRASDAGTLAYPTLGRAERAPDRAGTSG